MESIAPKLILVPTDFSAPSAQALRYGAALAERFSAHLLVIYADLFAPPEPAREQLQTFAEVNIPAAVPYDVRVVVSTPIEAIVAQASEIGASLIVMGTHGRTGLRRLLVGSVTEAVMRLAPVPVVIVQESAKVTTNARWIVGCVMPARECRAALRFATALADETTRFVLLGAADIADRPFTADDLKLLEVCTPDEIAGRAAFKAIDTVEPKDVLIAAKAEHADLIVLGIAGDRSLADTLRGTNVERIVQHSTCPVLTVNPFAARAVRRDVDVRAAAIA